MHTDDKHFPKLRHWEKLVGVNGDLADVILGVLSWVSISHGIVKVNLAEFYRWFAELSEEFPEAVPRFQYKAYSTSIGKHVYSKTLGAAIESVLQLGVSVAADFQNLEVQKDAAQRNLGRLKVRVGDAFVNRLKPLGDRLAELIRT